MKRIDNTVCHYLKIHRTAGNVAAFYDKMLASAGITTRQYSLLFEIGEHENCSVSELSKVTELDRTTLTRSLKPLFGLGLIEDKKIDGARNSVLSLTEKGSESRDQARILWMEAQKKVEKHIGKTRLDEFEAILELLAEL